MRLIHSKTLKLIEFSAKEIPPYAILSHTWGDGEVSLNDMQSSNISNISNKAGYDKIKRCCEVAADDGFEYAWVDTCCIDKTSSSELLEAINSMFQWYREAEVCYVYLSDVPSSQNPRAPQSAFSKSKWFTRGWTLQELIAPDDVIFYGSDWSEIGTKSSLQGIISEFTGIDVTALEIDSDLQAFSIAQRMSWASKRETTRAEDLAYCLMGIFAVSMPMLYGEGQRAFLRLQEEIMKGSDDPTIFAWQTERWMNHNGGLLALSPADFFQSGNIVRAKDVNRVSFTSTNRGIHLQLYCQVSDAHERSFLGILDCHEIGKSSHLLGIPLIESEKSENHVFRNRNGRMKALDESESIALERRIFYVKEEPSQDFHIQGETYNRCLVRATSGVSISGVYPNYWIRPDGEIDSMVPLYDGSMAALQIVFDTQEFWVVVLKMKGAALSANIITRFEDEGLSDVVSSFATSTARHQRTWDDEPGQIIRSLKESIFVTIRRKRVSSNRRLMVDISRVSLN